MVCQSRILYDASDWYVVQIPNRKIPIIGIILFMNFDVLDNLLFNVYKNL